MTLTTYKRMSRNFKSLDLSNSKHLWIQNPRETRKVDEVLYCRELDWVVAGAEKHEDFAFTFSSFNSHVSDMLLLHFLIRFIWWVNLYDE